MTRGRWRGGGQIMLMMRVLGERGEERVRQRALWHLIFQVWWNNDLVSCLETGVSFSFLNSAWRFFVFLILRCSSAPTQDPNILLPLLLFIMIPSVDPPGRPAVMTIPSPRSQPAACSTWPGGMPGFVRDQRGRRCLGWAWRRSGRRSVHTGALPVSNPSQLPAPLSWTWCNPTARRVFRTNHQFKRLILHESRALCAVCDPVRDVLSFEDRSEVIYSENFWKHLMNRTSIM